MILELGDDDNKKELSEDFKIEEADGTDVKVYEKGILGQTDYPCLCAKFDTNDEFIVSCYANGSIELYDAESWEYICHLEDGEEESKKGVCTMVKWKPGEESDAIIGVDIKGAIRRYSSKDRKEVDWIEPEVEDGNRLFALDYAYNGETFACGGTDKFVRVYDDATMKEKTILDTFYTNKAGHSNRIFAVSYCKSDANLIASAGWDSNIIISDIRQRGPISAFYGPYVCGDALEFYAGQVISGSWRLDNQIEYWDLKTNKLLKSVDWDGDNFESEEQCRIFWLEKSRSDSINSVMIAGGGNSDELRIFNYENKPVVNITDVSRSIFTCDISHHCDSFLFAGGDGAIRVWKLIVYN